jgi:hypothetical protein
MKNDLPKQNAPGEGRAGVDGAGGLGSTKKVGSVIGKFSTGPEILANKSTAIDVQLAKLVALLRQGPKTTIQLRSHGIMMPAARVFQLKRDHGLDVFTELVTLYDHEGILHQRCARYHLVEGKSEEGA